MSIFPIRLALLAIPVVIAAVILGVGSARGGGFLKKQGVAWVITGVMIVCAIGIGYAKAPVNNPIPEPDLPGAVNDDLQYHVRDAANVLSSQTKQTLSQRNRRLNDRYGVVVGVVTCNYGRDDLGDYALKQAEAMGLGGYDFIVALDISGDNYWLIQGDKLTRDFTDQMCSDYAYDYMEDYFARGMYDEAVLNLTEMLEAWYGTYYG